MREVFKTHPEFTNYEVSNKGRVRSKARNWLGKKYLKPADNTNGYLFVNLYQDGKPYKRYVHALVLETFVGPRPEGFQGSHLSGKRKNNNLSNLKWASPEENASHKIWHGSSRGLTEAEIALVRTMKSMGETATALAERFEISRSTVTSYVNDPKYAGKFLSPVAQEALRLGGDPRFVKNKPVQV